MTKLNESIFAAYCCRKGRVCMLVSSAEQTAEVSSIFSEAVS